MAFFANASNVFISGGTFTHVESTGIGLKLLLQNISEGAFHNAAERGDPPRCYPNTRKAIRAEIMEWINAPLPMRKLILWMYGPVGAGKTAIAQSIAEECERAGLLAASFFFSRTAPGRNNTTRFVATLAYQLSRHIPEIRPYTLAAIEQDPTIFSQSLSTQMRVLVIEPLKQAPPMNRPIFVVVDGLDELGPDGQSQADLLHLLASVALEFQHIPLIFLVASRPEYDIREAFNEDHLNSLAKVLVLDANYEPFNDIRDYLSSIFQEIHQKHRRLGSRLPLQWPDRKDLDILASEASGQFIFAATVTKFVSSPRHNPADRLNVILRMSTPGKETPFALIDALYHFILDSVADVEKVLEVVALIMLAGHYEKSELTLTLTEELLGIEARRVLIDMHSLVSVPPLPNDSLPDTYHASFYDFLMDRSRSLKHYIGLNQGHANLCRRWLKIIGTQPQSRGIRNSLATNALIDHCGKLPPKAILDELENFDLRTSMEGIQNFSYDLYRADFKGFIDCVEKQGGDDRKDVAYRLQNDIDSFILDRVAQYPPSLQTHVPILLSTYYLDVTSDIFELLLHAASTSPEELTELRNMDQRLLHVHKSRNDDGHRNRYMGKLFTNKARAGKHCVDGRGFAALAKAMINFICPKPGKNSSPFRFAAFRPPEIFARLYPEDDGTDPRPRIDFHNPRFPSFSRIFEYASKDMDLVDLMSKHAAQYREDVQPIPGWRKVIDEGMKYIKRCEQISPNYVPPPGFNDLGIDLRYM